MAIKGFEGLTHELTEFELATILPLIVAKLSAHKGKANSISNNQLQQYVKDRGHGINGPRIRKVVEHIRHSFLIENLIAGGRGYFIAQDPEEISNWLTSMKQRRSAITKTISAGEKSLRQMTGYRQANQYKQRKTDFSIIQPNILQ
jgi:hypothetical protein